MTHDNQLINVKLYHTLLAISDWHVMWSKSLAINTSLTTQDSRHCNI